VAKAIYQTKKLTVGKFGLGQRADRTGTAKEEVTDGDTISVRSAGNFSIRLLGVDAPESKFMLPNQKSFTSLNNIKWEEFLTNIPFNQFSKPITFELREYLKLKIKPGVALNHYTNAKLAERAFEQEIAEDMKILLQNEDTFEFFLAFANEIMDSYGRLLCFLNRFQENEITPTKRPLSYNERLLKLGKVLPYFIWPNINPFRTKQSIVNAVLRPNTANEVALSDYSLRTAREWVKTSREAGKGIYSEENNLMLAPFEIRYLAKLEPPSRWVIDLSKNEDIIYRPQSYFKIPNMEDRLFIPEEYVPLFLVKGWKIETI